MMTTTPIGLYAEDVLRHCRVFCEMQQGLVSKWRDENLDAKDFEMLVDFKKETTFVYEGVKWIGRKHGVGVRFDSEAGTSVDVPFNIDQADKFEPDRVYDYLVSVEAFNSLQVEKPRRNAIYITFDEFEREGKLTAFSYANGRKLYAIANINK